MAIYSLPQPVATIPDVPSVATDIINISLPNWQHGDLLYGQIILEPLVIDLGNLTGAREEYLSLWNVSGINLNLVSIDENGAEGLNLIGQETGLIYNNQTLLYTLQASPKGPNTIDATYSWNFLESFGATLSITGSRVPLFDWDINWGISPVIYYTHNTNIIESHNGKENRYGLTENPRLAFEYNYLLLGSNMRDFDNLVYNNQDAVFQVPLYHQRAEITQNASTGDTVIYIDSSNTDIQEGYNIYVGDYNNNQILKIISFDKLSGLAVLENNLTSDISDGDSVYILAPCRINSELSIASQIRTLNQATVRFELQDDTIENIVETDTNFELYDGLEVLYQKPAIDITTYRNINRKVEVLNNNFGIREYYYKDKSPEVIMTYRFDVIGSDEISNVLSFFNNKKGRLNEFLITSGVKDMVVVDNISPNVTTILIENNGQVDYNDNVQKQLIRMELANGNVYIRKILNILTDGDDLRLFLDESFGEEILLTDIMDVQFLSNARLNNDTLQVEMVTSEFASIIVDMKIFRNYS